MKIKHKPTLREC